jgi:uncharacterized protein with PIN domain
MSDTELLRKLMSVMRCPKCGGKFYKGSHINGYTEALCTDCELHVWMDLEATY